LWGVRRGSRMPLVRRPPTCSQPKAPLRAARRRAAARTRRPITITRLMVTQYEYAIADCAMEPTFRLDMVYQPGGRVRPRPGTRRHSSEEVQGPCRS
jgi:hypothetical protein